MPIRFADPEFEANFQAYLNYLEDLAGVIAGHYGLGESLVSGVHDGVLTHPPLRRIQRRRLGSKEAEALHAALRKAWGDLRRIQREVDDQGEYDEEANAWLPAQAYYSVYHAVLALAVSTGQPVPRDHAAALRLIGQEIRRGGFPFPWSAYCEGCPQTGTHLFGGLRPSGAEVHVLSSPDPSTSADRLAMFLRTTRARELERRFAEVRRKASPGRIRHNLSRARKDQIATRVAPTTIFDLYWRMRRKANYDDADAFVLGAVDALHARRFANALALVTDATVAALEAVMSAHVGPDVMATAAEAYRGRARSDPGEVLARRVESWRRRANGVRSLAAVGERVSHRLEAR